MDDVYTVFKYNLYFNVVSGTEETDSVVCDVVQEVQDWLMREFDPGTLWSYAPIDQQLGALPFLTWGRERVLLQPEVYTALVLRWA